MATEINLKKNNLRRKGIVGFSWTTLFFGFFVPLFRGDWIWFIIMLIVGALGFITAGLVPLIANIILSFMYNKIYTRNLLEQGWEPADEFSYNILFERGIVSKN